MSYVLRPEEAVALRALQSIPHTGPGIRAVLLEGPPGCGKTAFTEHLAQALGASYLYHLVHTWTDDQELFAGVDVAAAVAGDAAAVRQDGILTLAATRSHGGPIVLCLDEVDKAQDRTEYLLLDFLQSGRVQTRPGHHVAANPANLVVCLTTNGTRDLSDPLLRRVRRVRMRPLTRDAMVSIAANITGTPTAVIRAATKIMCDECSVQELSHGVREMWLLAQSAADCALIATQWLRRDGTVSASQCAAVWGEIAAARRTAGGAT